ncbi:MAG: peptide ABC transporter substrate-binding protein, partial [Deltaproteobacteria bacterium]|nr:peptide ABC transporter substrate-binding protein [Deltaproteobacteria bacterium]
MTTRRVLIFAPLILTLILLQSYFWVPTYDQQARGNPNRLNEYINGSIGDASVLNPILSADSASSEINGQVFEGLIDRDEELRFRSRLAKSWTIFEEAFFYVNETATIPELGHATAQQIVDFLRGYDAKAENAIPGLQKTLANIKTISLIPAKEYKFNRQIKSADAGPKTTDVTVTIA